MKRTSLAVIAAVAALAAYGSNAQACISCDYVPEVLRSGDASSGSTYQARPSKRVRDYSEQREKRSSKKRVTTRESAPEKSSRSSKADEPAKSTASVAPAAPAVTEHSAITTKGSSIANQVKAAVTPVQTGPQTENSTISTLVQESSKPDAAHPVEHVAADKTVGCKKYFPSTGLTLSVPCE